MPDLVVKKISLGYGLFTSSVIFRGEVVETFYRGELLPVKGFSPQDWRDSYLLQVTKDCYLAPPPGLKREIAQDSISELNYAWFTNHSCDPNTSVMFPESYNVLGYDARRPFLIASRNIMPGEQITFDYSTTQTHPWQMICQCNSEKCRDTIGPAHRLPLSTVVKYALSGRMPAYAIRDALLSRW